MGRTYGATRSLVKPELSYRVPNSMRPILMTLAVSLLAAGAAEGQGLPELAPLNPMGSSRSGLYFQPYQDPAPGRWVAKLALDYASVIEYNRLPQADYVLDSELLRIGLGLTRDLDSRAFLSLSASLGGAYGGFLDGFLDWYHSALGIQMIERERRPRDRFLYTVTLPDGSSVSRSRSNLFLGDARVGLGLRHSPSAQSLLSLTLPTSTGPAGFGRGVPSISLLNTLRHELRPGLLYEGSVNFGFTPIQGDLLAEERELFVAASSGLRFRAWGRQFLYANLFYHSPYYSNTTLPALDSRELSLDFGWILQSHQGTEWRVGMTEDLEPGGPGVDLVLRFGRNF
jgi:Protein of unknown function (DUF3187)